MEPESHQDPAGSACVTKKADGSEDHGTGFHGRISLAVLSYCDSESGERNGRSGAEKTCEAFGAQYFSNDSKQTDDDTTDKETKGEFFHHEELYVRTDQAAFRAFSINWSATAVVLQPRSLYRLPSRL
jgi:hypothetical protein